MAVKITARDAALIHTVSLLRIVPLDLLAERFFQRDPFRGTANADPPAACERRLRALASAGLLWLQTVDDGRTLRRVATPGPVSENLTGVDPDTRRVPARNRAHHVRTLDALGVMERVATARGWCVVSTLFEQDLRAKLQRGARTERGQQYPAFPDAVCTYENKGAHGKTRTIEMAVEYVTGKYTDADIRRKAASFRRYQTVFWAADSKHTAERVRKLTRKHCMVLP